MTKDNTKHAPGPVTPLCDCGCWSENMAEARLIAAAPDLLEALRGLTESVQRMVDRLDAEPGNQVSVLAWSLKLDAAKAAIAKAEGRS